MSLKRLCTRGKYVSVRYIRHYTTELDATRKEICHKLISPPDGSKRMACTLDNVFTNDECLEWIQKTEEKGYETALVNMGGGKQKLLEKYRKSKRCIVDSEEWTKKLEDRIISFLPPQFHHGHLLGLNKRLRFLKYEHGDYFTPHRDGIFEETDEIGKSQSFITVQLYLSEGFQGGSTTFLSADKKVECIPKIGRVLLFDHRLLHESSPLISGMKYAVRTDVMYRI